MAQLNFDANTVDPNVAFDPVPAGWYNVKIVESELKPTSNGNGAYLQLTMEVLDGDYAGRKLFDRLNLQNPNQTAVEIAYKTLSAICRSTGVMQCQDSTQLHGIPMQAKATVRPADGQYDAQNEVKGYRACGEGGGAQQAPQQQMPGQPQQTPPMSQQPPQMAQQPMQQPPQQQQPAWQQPQQQMPQQAQPQQPAPNQTPDTQTWSQQPQQAAPQQAPVQQPQQNAAPVQQGGPSAGGQPGIPPWAQQQ